MVLENLMKKQILILATLSAVASANAILLDNFTTGAYSVSLSLYQDDLHLSPAAGVLGNQRLTYLGVSGNPHSLHGGMTIGNGLASFNNDTRVETYAQLIYGGDLVGITPLNYNMLAMNSIDINFDSNDQDLLVYVDLFRHSELGFSLYTQTRVITGGRSGTPFTESFDISGDSLRGDVDMISITMVSAPGGDYALTKVSAVPEPATMTVLAAGLSTIFARRRKSANS